MSPLENVAVNAVSPFVSVARYADSSVRVPSATPQLSVCVTSVSPIAIDSTVTPEGAYTVDVTSAGAALLNAPVVGVNEDASSMVTVNVAVSPFENPTVNTTSPLSSVTR